MGAWTGWLDEAGRPLTWDGPMTGVVGTFDPTPLIQALDALIAWRATQGRRGDPARIAWSAEDVDLRLEWIEEVSVPSGPLEGREGRSISLALPMLARVMTAHRGSLAISRQGGLCVRMRWPRRRAGPAPA